ncbi:MAG: hypothetical protein JF597_50680 [Streptomyces sp.]|uniref:GAF domain-containing sensor histidine kinase n=1 Tax=Streptomyces sp. TaxID=1931 RepID=UPI0025F420D4|nr:ATP-binding protein [Streptomyces sp.]MBW8801515.1 hypothetical protein [Streptomyces sp.]
MHRLRAVDHWSRLAAVTVLTAFVIGVYVVIVLGGGALLGGAEAPSLGLSALATVVVALAFERVRRWSATWSARVFRRSGFSPYEVLSRFSETVTGGIATEEVPQRMARLLREGTNAEWAQVWLVVHDQLVPAAEWPAGAGAADVPALPGTVAEGRRTVTVRHGGQVYGAFRLQERAGVPLSSVEERLFAGLAAQAGMVLRLVGLQAELTARYDELTARTEELRGSRERLIATQDAERRRLERDIHDGAQQHLVALAVNLRLVQVLAAKDPARARQLLDAQAEAARAATDTLSRLARGMYPSHLAELGLAPALRASVAVSSVPVEVTDLGQERRPEPVEAALYFFAMEAVQNAAKHASAAHIAVRIVEVVGATQVTVEDDGKGFASASPGSGMANMRDRIDALQGTVTLESEPGRGTRVCATVPVRAEAVV